MIKIPQTSSVSLYDVRSAVSACIEAAVLPDSPNTQVHNHWAMAYDIETTKEYISRDGFIHAWMVTIDEIVPADKGIGGRVGGGVIEIPLNIRIFGFIGYNYDATEDGAYAVLEKECISIIKTLYLNEIDLGNPDLSDNIHDVKMLEFEKIETRSFGSGDDLIVAEGNLELVWREEIKE